jgi:hypothetical protein
MEMVKRQEFQQGERSIAGDAEIRGREIRNPGTKSILFGPGIARR